MICTFERLQSSEHSHECAQLMASSEPWITLRRDYDAAVKLIQDATAETWLAKAEGKFVGFAVVRWHGAFSGYIQSIVVKPELRGLGVGAQFLQFLEERIFARHPNVFICCSSFNPRALELYKRRQYEVVGELKDYLVRGHSEFLLRKTIAPISEFHPVYT